MWNEDTEAVPHASPDAVRGLSIAGAGDMEPPVVRLEHVSGVRRPQGHLDYAGLRAPLRRQAAHRYAPGYRA